MKTDELGQLMTGGNRVSQERKHKLNELTTRNHVFWITEPQKVLKMEGNRYLLEVLGAETEELVV